jgi:hypothetical protein
MHAFSFGVSFLFTLGAIVMFIIGCLGYADRTSTMQCVAWMRSSKVGVQVYFSLKKVYATYDDPLFGKTYSYLTSYGSDGCIEDWCDNCHKDGNIAFALLVVAIVFAACTVPFVWNLFLKLDRTLVMVGTAFAFSSACCSLIGFCFFMTDCYNKVHFEIGADDAVPADFSYKADVKWGPGSILALVGMLLMWLVTIILALTLRTPPASHTTLANHKV